MWFTCKYVQNESICFPKVFPSSSICLEYGQVINLEIFAVNLSFKILITQAHLQILCWQLKSMTVTKLLLLVSATETCSDITCLQEAIVQKANSTPYFVLNKLLWFVIRVQQELYIEAARILSSINMMCYDLMSCVFGHFWLLKNQITIFFYVIMVEMCFNNCLVPYLDDFNVTSMYCVLNWKYINIQTRRDKCATLDNSKILKIPHFKICACSFSFFSNVIQSFSLQIILLTTNCLKSRMKYLHEFLNILSMEAIRHEENLTFSFYKAVNVDNCTLLLMFK